MATTQQSPPVRRRRIPVPPQRLDIQGLRMVAVLLVIVDHLFGWPRGGFIGVDVFFVVSGFLITGLLLREYDKTGSISFSGFYRRRIRRIVPIATLVLLVTCAAGTLVFASSRASSITMDALWAFFFASNWRFAIEGTDYFNADAAVSPLQHYWSLSVEEQFYFVWPALMLLMGVLVTRQEWNGNVKRLLSAAVMGVVVAASFAWALHDTEANQTWAYFSTFTRVWELGAGALLAIGAGWISRVPRSARAPLAWVGLATITAGAFVISESGAFPAPAAALPVLGAALVIAAGIGGPTPYITPLTNPVSVYVGNISYSLYLWHWPIIVILGSIMDVDVYYYVTVLAATFGLSVASYHFVENPIRHSNFLEPKAVRAESKRKRRNKLGREFTPPSIRYAGLGALTLVTVAVGAFSLKPIDPPATPPARTAASTDAAAAADAPVVPPGPAETELAAEIDTAVNAAEWPELNPTMDQAIIGAQAPEGIAECGLVNRPDPAQCTWGAADAPKTIMVLGDSMAMSFVQPIKNFAEASGGQWKVRSEAMFGCTFVDMEVTSQDAETLAACPGRKAAAIAAVNEVKPDVVLITNLHTDIAADLWIPGVKRLVDQFSSNVGKILFLAAPPNDKKPADCYTRTSKPADCLSRVTDLWTARSRADRNLAYRVGGTYVDTRALFCTPDNYCPSFVGTTPMKSDSSHMTIEYGKKVSPAFAELLQANGV
ncbi:acyltransferase [Rhodococcus sp. 06-412-2C]|uniref:acyltransferase family protein n=1 Tax=unclassified Rhodococcus (in: high G+C Gram-positive bacteria) TaxID=192944 RepID=UPI000B9C46F8|nr:MULTISPECIES: acyltransferase family protein [unclassified Rhodococcus (in: high G+C Gram-positive bacteria)]OZC83650.1 acyltransferase [Rhodococcus sp. 06-412-2C]OZC93837.1 acyltransferase [Rhodococcus sp. 06-412-2B]